MENSNSPGPEQIAQKVFDGEYSTVDELRMAINLILNASGTESAGIKNQLKEMIQYSANKKDFNGVEYIPVKDIERFLEEIQ